MNDVMKGMLIKDVTGLMISMKRSNAVRDILCLGSSTS